METLQALTVEHARAVEQYERAIGKRAEHATEANVERVERCAAYVAAISTALDVAIEQRGGVPADVPSQTLLASGAVDTLRTLDIGSSVPDPLDGARHTVKRGRNRKGSTAIVIRRGTAPVIGSTSWDVERLTAHIGERAASVAAFLASDRLASVRRLTLGSPALDVERAADAILSALDVDPLDGTDAMSWQRVERADNVEHDEDADAMTVAILAGETLDTLVALSRQRAGICGGYVADVDLSDVTTASVPPRRRVAPAQSAYRDHGVDPSQLSSGRVSVAALADVTAPTVETAGWPTMGPSSARPRVPVWRKRERALFEQSTERGPWHAVGDPSRLVGRSTRRPALPACRDAAHRWHHSSDATCQLCEHYGDAFRASERVHVGCSTVDRAAPMTSSGSRPSTRRERAALTLARQRVEQSETLDAPSDDLIAERVAALDPGETVRFTTSSAIGSVHRSTSGARFTVRCDGERIGSPRNVERATALALASFGI